MPAASTLPRPRAAAVTMRGRVCRNAANQFPLTRARGRHAPLGGNVYAVYGHSASRISTRMPEMNWRRVLVFIGAPFLRFHMREQVANSTSRELCSECSLRSPPRIGVALPHKSAEASEPGPGCSRLRNRKLPITSQTFTWAFPGHQNSEVAGRSTKDIHSA